MAAFLLRSSAGCLSTQLLQRSVPRVSSATLQQRHLTVSPVRQGREYGPSEGKLPAYTSHWTQHRYQMISMIPLIPAALAFPHPALDLALCGSLLLHSYWGIGGMVSDYFHDKTLNLIGNAILMTVTIAAMAGLFYLTYNDVGFAKTVRKIYSEL